MATKIYGETGVRQVQDGIITDEKISSTNSNFLNNFNCMRFDNYLWVRDEKSAGVGGGSSVALTWNTRTLNTIKYNTIPGASLSSNRITLDVGSYYVKATAPAWQVGIHQLAVYNVNTAQYILYGQGAYANENVSAHGFSNVRGVLSFNTPTSIEFRHYTIAASAAQGLGAFMTNSICVYTEVEIWKIG